MKIGRVFMSFKSSLLQMTDALLAFVRIFLVTWSLVNISSHELQAKVNDLFKSNVEDCMMDW